MSSIENGGKVEVSLTTCLDKSESGGQEAQPQSPAC